jgi:exosortase/archaeosortase family protein
MAKKKAFFRKSLLRKKPREETKRGWREKRKRQRKRTEQKNKFNVKVIGDIAARYLALLLASLNSLWIFYFFFTPLTMQASAFLLKFFYDVEVYINAIVVNSNIISMVKACVAGAAYYLLLILNLTTTGIKFRKRIAIFVFDAIMFFALNVIRIAILVIMQVNNLAWFDVTHKIFWYGISTVYVVLIWLLTISLFKIKEIPVYSDFRLLLKQAKFSRRSKRK